MLGELILCLETKKSEVTCTFYFVNTHAGILVQKLWIIRKRGIRCNDPKCFIFKFHTFPSNFVNFIRFSSRLMKNPSDVVCARLVEGMWGRSNRSGKWSTVTASRTPWPGDVTLHTRARPRGQVRTRFSFPPYHTSLMPRRLCKMSVFLCVPCVRASVAIMPMCILLYRRIFKAHASTGYTSQIHHVVKLKPPGSPARYQYQYIAGVA